MQNKDKTLKDRLTSTNFFVRFANSTDAQKAAEQMWIFKYEFRPEFLNFYFSHVNFLFYPYKIIKILKANQLK